MTDIDTSTEAIERLAEDLLFRGHHHQEKITHLLRRLHVERITASKTIRALAAERDRLRDERRTLVASLKDGGDIQRKAIERAEAAESALATARAETAAMVWRHGSPPTGTNVAWLLIEEPDGDGGASLSVVLACHDGEWWSEAADYKAESYSEYILGNIIAWQPHHVPGPQMTPADATAALEAIRRQERAAGKAEGMREAAGTIREMWASTSAEHESAILARAEAIEKGATE